MIEYNTSASEFSTRVEQDARDFQPLGEKIASYTRRKAGEKGKGKAKSAGSGSGAQLSEEDPEARVFEMYKVSRLFRSYLYAASGPDSEGRAEARDVQPRSWKTPSQGSVCCDASLFRLASARSSLAPRILPRAATLDISAHDTGQFLRFSPSLRHPGPHPVSANSIDGCKFLCYSTSKERHTS